MDKLEFDFKEVKNGRDILQCGVVYKTKNYKIFKQIEGNRRINKTNYAKLVHSMREEQLMIPIIVNEKMEIIDGQHRKISAEELGLFVYFVVVPNYGLSQVRRANITSANWDKSNYLDMFLAERQPVYIEFNEVVEEYGLTICSLLKILSIVQGKQLPLVHTEFQEGKLTLEGKETLIDFLEALEDFNFFRDYKTPNFLTAFGKLYFRTNYNHEKMKIKLESHGYALERRSTSDEYLILLCNKIYSFGLTKNPIYYSSDRKKFHQ